MVRLITRPLKFLSLWSIKQAFSVIRFTSPHLIRMLLFCIGAAITGAAVVTISAIRGVDPVAKMIAKDWKKQTIEAGLFPTIYEDKLDTPYYYLATVMIYVGWVVMFFITLFIFNFVFTWLL